LKSARNALPEEPPGGVTCGIDWARDDHAVPVVSAGGREIHWCSVEHSAAGLRELAAVLARAGAREAAIERPGGPVVDALLEAGVTAVVISPNQVTNLRGRHGSAGNKDDRFDAFVLADTLRTDRARLVPLTPDSPATVALRRACRARNDLISHRVGAASQLRAHLRGAFPGAVGLFAEIDSPISLRFLAASSPRTAWTGSRPGAWRPGWPPPATAAAPPPPSCTHAWPPRPAVPPATTAPRMPHVTAALHAVLTTLAEQVKILSGQIGEQLALHADAHVFTSLPRSGTVRAARLLAEIGDCRARFPAPESLACLAGAAPSTRQSGKARSVTFRWSCDKQLRDAVTDFAGDSRHASPQAASRYRRARAHDHPHAVRILARAWLFVIWHCWQDETAYDPARHRALQTLLNQDQQPAA
jgi:transposase